MNACIRKSLKAPKEIIGSYISSGGTDILGGRIIHANVVAVGGTWEKRAPSHVEGRSLQAP
jgi:hypothetical protein